MSVSLTILLVVLVSSTWLTIILLHILKELAKIDKQITECSALYKQQFAALDRK